MFRDIQTMTRTRGLITEIVYDELLTWSRIANGIEGYRNNYVLNMYLKVWFIFYRIVAYRG